MFYTRSNGVRVRATMVGFAPDGLLHLEYFQDAVKVVSRQYQSLSCSGSPLKYRIFSKVVALQSRYPRYPRKWIWQLLTFEDRNKAKRLNTSRKSSQINRLKRQMRRRSFHFGGQKCSSERAFCLWRTSTLQETLYMHMYATPGVNTKYHLARALWTIKGVSPSGRALC